MSIWKKEKKIEDKKFVAKPITNEARDRELFEAKEHAIYLEDKAKAKGMETELLHAKMQAQFVELLSTQETAAIYKFALKEIVANKWWGGTDPEFIEHLQSIAKEAIDEIDKG